jgi:hypothetical protein
MIVFFSQYVSSKGMFTILYSSAATCRLFILVFGFLFYGSSRWDEDMNNAYGFSGKREMVWV